MLAPHFDDACFALGGVLTRLSAVGEEAVLVNIFTEGDHVARKNKRVPRPPREVARRIRQAEDTAFAQICGLRREDLHCEEPSLRGRLIRQMAFIDDDVRQIEAPLTALLEQLAPPVGDPRKLLFVPLGLGWHINHRAVARYVASHQSALQQHFDICFYEDMPYASHPRARLCGLWRQRRVLDGLQRCYLPLGWSEKQSLVKYYPSQFRKAPRALRFRPAALWPLSVHEAFWCDPAVLSLRR